MSRKSPDIVCIGDSNTYGYDPRSWIAGRYEKPWPEQLSLISGMQVENLGSNGRTIPADYSLFSGLSGKWLIVMLGTNDLLQGYSPERISGNMDRFLKALSGNFIHTLLLAPPAMALPEFAEQRDYVAETFRGIAEREDYSYADPALWGLELAFDGVHLTEDSHRLFAEKVWDCLNCI